MCSGASAQIVRTPRFEDPESRETLSPDLRISCDSGIQQGCSCPPADSPAGAARRHTAICPYADRLTPSASSVQSAAYCGRGVRSLQSAGIPRNTELYLLEYEARTP